MLLANVESLVVGRRSGGGGILGAEGGQSGRQIGHGRGVGPQSPSMAQVALNGLLGFMLVKLLVQIKVAPQGWLACDTG